MNKYLFLLTASAIAYLPSPVIAQDLTVATWNLEHFAGQDYSGCRERTQKDYDAIREIVNKIDADVWLLQEVESAGSLTRIMDPTQWEFISESREEIEQPATCRNSDRPMTMQRTAMAVRRGLLTANHADLSFLDVSGSGYLRHGLAVNLTFQGSTVQIVNVHLKSGCFDGINSEACPVLFEQVPYLASYATQVSQQGIPLLLGGDFNRRLGDPEDEAMITLTYNKKTGLEIASPDGPSACSTSGRLPIDYQLTNRSFIDRFAIKSAKEIPFKGQFEDWPSDHCPVVVTYTVR